MEEHNGFLWDVALAVCGFIGCMFVINNSANLGQTVFGLAIALFTVFVIAIDK